MGSGKNKALLMFLCGLAILALVLLATNNWPFSTDETKPTTSPSPTGSGITPTVTVPTVTTSTSTNGATPTETVSSTPTTTPSPTKPIVLGIIGPCIGSGCGKEVSKYSFKTGTLPSKLVTDSFFGSCGEGVNLTISIGFKYDTNLYSDVTLNIFRGDCNNFPVTIFFEESFTVPSNTNLVVKITNNNTQKEEIRDIAITEIKKTTTNEDAKIFSYVTIQNVVNPK